MRTPGPGQPRARARIWHLQHQEDVRRTMGVRIGWLRGAVFLISTLLGAVVLMPPAASAHSQLLATTPAASATVTAPISEVPLPFNEPVYQRFSIVMVSGPG